MARENTKYLSINATSDQAERFDKLAERVGMTRNSLFRLVMERMQVADVDAMLKRGD